MSSSAGAGGRGQRDVPVITERGRHALLQKFGTTEMSDARGITRARLLSRFVNDLASKRFGGIVLGYEDVLLDTWGCHTMPLKEIASEMRRLLRAGVMVGVVSRMDDADIVRELRHVVDAQYWDATLVACCNGARVHTLDDDYSDEGRGDGGANINDNVLESFFDYLASQKIIQDDIITHPHQISIMKKSHNDGVALEIIRRIESSGMAGPEPVKVLDSGRYVDIVRRSTSRYGIVRAIRDAVPAGRHVLCIGCSGRWPAADCEMLTHRHSLSTGPVSATASSCWNLLPQATGGEQGALEYLRCAATPGDGSFFISM